MLWRKYVFKGANVPLYVFCEVSRNVLEPCLQLPKLSSLAAVDILLSLLEKEEYKVVTHCPKFLMLCRNSYNG